MKIMILIVLSINVNNYAVLPEKVQYIKQIEHKDGKANRRSRRKNR